MGKTAATFEKEAHDESGLQNPSGLAYVDQNMAQRVLLEEEFEEKALAAISEAKTKSARGMLHSSRDFCNLCRFSVVLK